MKPLVEDMQIQIAQLRRMLELESAAHTVCARARAEAEDRAIILAEENAALQAKLDEQSSRDDFSPENDPFPDEGLPTAADVRGILKDC